MFAPIVAVALKDDQQDPKNLLEKYPVSAKEYVHPVDENKFKNIFEKYKDIEPK